MTDESVADIAATIAAAETMIGATSSADAHADLAGYLRDEQLALPLPELNAEDAAMVCVDGAVACEQTDTLAWIAAVATDSTSRVMRRKTMVVPVSSSMDQVRSAVMALCEMSVAVELYDCGIDAWMDGGLVTPLLSVATAVQSADPQTATALCDLLDEVDAAAIIDGYIDHATQGSMSRCPNRTRRTRSAWRGRRPTPWTSRPGYGCPAVGTARSLRRPSVTGSSCRRAGEWRRCGSRRKLRGQGTVELRSGPAFWRS